MALTDVMIRKAKPREKQFKLYDRNGLFMLVLPNGGRYWHFRYRFGAREKLVSLGTYPTVTLKEARKRCMDARRLVSEGVDPSVQRQRQRAALSNSFGEAAREWYEKFRIEWSEEHARTVEGRLALHLAPALGSRPIGEIEAPELLAILQRLERAGKHETAHRLRQIAESVFAFAIASGLATRNPAADLKKALAKREAKHFPAVLDPAQLGSILRTFDAYAAQGTPVVSTALRLAPLLAVRPAELRKMEWQEVDLDRALWVLPSWKTKSRRSLIIPLAQQTVALLRELRDITGHQPWVFPNFRRNSRNPMMSNAAVLTALRACGVPNDVLVGHSFRAIFRTLADEQLGARVDHIEHALGHRVVAATGYAYDRTTHLVERAQLAQAWADYLDSLKSAAARTAQA
jgi:integrase